MDCKRQQQIIDDYIDGKLDSSGYQELEQLIRKNPEFANQFVSSTHLEALLEQKSAGGDFEAPDLLELYQQKRHGTPLQRLPQIPLPDIGFIQHSIVWPTVLFVIAIPLALLLVGNGESEGPLVGSNKQQVCKVYPLENIEWTSPEQSKRDALNDGSKVGIKSGRIRLAFNDGTELIATGPSELTVVNRYLVDLSYGTVTLDVKEKSKKKFRILTPTARILDLGTRFGVSVPITKDETEVAVFKGAVELERSEGSKWSTPHILQAGDSVKVMPDHRVHRLVSFRADKYFSDTSQSSNFTVISRIRDNLSDQETSKSYRVVPGGMQEEALAYVDRMDEWNGLTESGIPDFLVGADYIMPFMEGRYYTRLQLEIEVESDAYIYLLVDKQIDIPMWIKDRFVDTGHFIGLDQGYTLSERNSTASGPGFSIDKIFSIYRTTVAAGESILLEELAPNDSSVAMYGVCAAPIDRLNAPMNFDRSQVIKSVSDNISKPFDKGYHVFIGGMHEDALAYADRLHEWNSLGDSGLPELLTGADVVVTNNDDRFVKGYNLNIEIVKDSDVFIIWEDRVPHPAWLLNSFTPTDAKLGLDEGITPRANKDKGVGAGKSIDSTFTIWTSRFTAGETVALGDIGTSDRHTNMYGVCLKEVSSSEKNAQ